MDGRVQCKAVSLSLPDIAADGLDEFAIDETAQAFFRGVVEPVPHGRYDPVSYPQVAEVRLVHGRALGEDGEVEEAGPEFPAQAIVGLWQILESHLFPGQPIGMFRHW